MSGTPAPVKRPPGRPRKAPAALRTAKTIAKPIAAALAPGGGFVEVEVLQAFSNHLAVKVLPGAVIRLPVDFAQKMTDTGMARHV